MFVLCWILGGMFAFIGIIAQIEDADPYTRKTALVILLIGIALIVYGVFLYKKRKQTRKDEEERLALLNENIRKIQDGTLKLEPIETSSILLKDGEAAYFENDTFVTETKTKAVGSVGSGGGVSVRVAKGVRVHSGSSASKKVYKDITEHYPGKFIITNQRLVFLSIEKPFDIPYSKLTGTFASNYGLIVQSGSKSYTISDSAPGLLVASINQIRSM